MKMLFQHVRIWENNWQKKPAKPAPALIRGLPSSGSPVRSKLSEAAVSSNGAFRVRINNSQLDEGISPVFSIKVKKIKILRMVLGNSVINRRLKVISCERCRECFQDYLHLVWFL